MPKRPSLLIAARRYLNRSSFMVVVLIIVGYYNIRWLRTDWNLTSLVALVQTAITLFSELKFKKYGITLAIALVSASLLWYILESKDEQLIALILSGANLGLQIIPEREEKHERTAARREWLDRIYIPAKQIVEDYKASDGFAEVYPITVYAEDGIVTLFREKKYYKSIDSIEDEAVSLIHKQLGRSNCVLLLGGPASGKTTCLRKLMDKLLDEYQQKTKSEVPALFRLSGWSIEWLNLTEWLVNELKKNYYLPENVATSMVLGRNLVFLLDGLDEVEDKCRKACVDQINEFCNDKERSEPQLVVTCRSNDFKPLPDLELFAAITLLPLSLAQIETHLQSLGPNAQAIQNAVFTSKAVRELAASPFFLRAMTIAYGTKGAVNFGPGEPLDVIQHRILDAYVDETFNHTKFHRKLEQVHLWPKEVTLRFLSNIAVYLGEMRETQLFLDRVQPDFLEKRTGTDKITWAWYAATVALITGLIGGGIGSIGADVFLRGFVPYPHNVYGSLAGALAVALTGSLYGGTSIGRNGFVTAVLSVFLGEYIWPQINIQVASALTGFAVGLTTIVNKELGYFLPSKISNDAYRLRFVIGLASGLIVISIIAVGFVLPFNILLASFTLFLVGSFIGISFGFLTRSKVISAFRKIGFVESYELSMNSDEIAPREALQWYWRNWAAYMIITFAISVVVIGFRARDLTTPLLIALTISMLAGFRSITRDPDAHVRLRPNYAIKSSLKTMGIISCTGVLLGLVATYLRADIYIGISYAVAMIASAVLAFGGYAVIQHLVLRLVLYRSNYIPFFVGRFLDYTGTLMLTRRVGGSYEFVHSFIQNYFEKRRI